MNLKRLGAVYLLTLLGYLLFWLPMYYEHPGGKKLDPPGRVAFFNVKNLYRNNHPYENTELEFYYHLDTEENNFKGIFTYRERTPSSLKNPYKGWITVSIENDMNILVLFPDYLAENGIKNILNHEFSDNGKNDKTGLVNKYEELAAKLRTEYNAKVENQTKYLVYKCQFDKLFIEILAITLAFGSMALFLYSHQKDK